MRIYTSQNVVAQLCCLVCALAMLGVTTQGAFAQGASQWINTGGGDWSNPANWSNGVPGLADAAVFDLDSFYTVTGFSPLRTIIVQRGSVTIDMAGKGMASSLDCIVNIATFLQLQNGFIDTNKGSFTATGRGFMVIQDFAFTSVTGNFTIELEMTLVRTVIQMGSGTLQMKRCAFHYCDVLGPSIVVNDKWVLYDTPILSGPTDTAILNADLVLTVRSELKLGSVSGPGWIELRDSQVVGPISGCKIIGSGRVLGVLSDVVIAPGVFFKYGTIQLGDPTQSASLVAPVEILLDVGVPDLNGRRYDQIVAFSTPPSITCCTGDGLQKNITVRVEDFGTGSTDGFPAIGDQFDLVVGQPFVWEGPFDWEGSFGVSIPDLGLEQQMKTVLNCQGFRAFVVEPGGEAPICADASCDGIVTFDDINEILSHWNSGYSNADVDENGSVGITDIMVVLMQWLNVCP